MRQSDKRFVSDSWHFLIGAWSIEIQQTGVSGIEFLIIDLPNFDTLRTIIAEKAGTLNLVVLVFSVESMNVEILILID